MRRTGGRGVIEHRPFVEEKCTRSSLSLMDKSCKTWEVVIDIVFKHCIAKAAFSSSPFALTLNSHFLELSSNTSRSFWFRNGTSYVGIRDLVLWQCELASKGFLSPIDLRWLQWATMKRHFNLWGETWIDGYEWGASRYNLSISVFGHILYQRPPSKSVLISEILLWGWLLREEMRRLTGPLRCWCW